MEHGGDDNRASEMDLAYGDTVLHATPYFLIFTPFRVMELLDEHGAVHGDDDPYGRGRFGAVPASEAEIARLPAATVGEVKERDCAVCLESFQEGEELRKMTCPGSHGFHEDCIFQWLRVSRLCPLCRFALPAQEEDDDAAESDEEANTGVMLESIEAEEIDMDVDTGTGSETLVEPVEEEAGASSQTFTLVSLTYYIPGHGYIEYQ